MNNKEFKAINGTAAYLFAVVANLAVQLAAAAIATVVKSSGADLLKNTFFNLFLMLAIQAGFVLVYWLTVIRRGDNGIRVNFRGRVKPLTAAVAAAAGVLCILAFYPAALWFSLFLERLGFEGSGLVEFKTAGEFVLGAFVLIIAAPIGEELIFRSALLSGVYKKRKGVSAVLLAALAFTLMHMNPSQTAYQFLLGLVLGFAALYTRSFIVPAVIHGVSNLCALILDYTALGGLVNSFVSYFETRVAAGVFVSLAFTLVFGAAVAVMVLLMKRLEKGRYTELTCGALTSPPPPFGNEGEGESVKAAELPLARTEKFSMRLMFLFSAGMCLLMWIASLAAGIMGIT